MTPFFKTCWQKEYIHSVYSLWVNIVFFLIILILPLFKKGFEQIWNNMQLSWMQQVETAQGLKNTVCSKWFVDSCRWRTPLENAIRWIANHLLLRRGWLQGAGLGCPSHNSSKLMAPRLMVHRLVISQRPPVWDGLASISSRINWRHVSCNAL